MERLKNMNDDYYIKIGRTSITIKDQQGKTRGVIRNINTWNSLQFNQKVDWNIKFKKMGINIQNIADKLIFDHNKVYYLFNKKLYNEQKEMIRKLKDKEGYCLNNCINIINKMDREAMLCKSNNITVLYVNM